MYIQTNLHMSVKKLLINLSEGIYDYQAEIWETFDIDALSVVSSLKYVNGWKRRSILPLPLPLSPYKSTKFTFIVISRALKKKQSTEKIRRHPIKSSRENRFIR